MSFNIGYYPGCSGLGTSIEYETSTRAVCQKLGITLVEIPDWSCCGSTPAHTVDHVLSTALVARNFAQAETAGISTMITPCPSCLKNLRNATLHLEDPEFRARVDALTQRPLKHAHTVKSVLQILVEDIGLDTIKSFVVKPLTGLKVVPYYGCLMQRPESTMHFDDPENPMALDNLLEALGAEVLPFPAKTECCGASYAIPCKEVVTRLTGKVLGLADSLGADLVVVACPLCQMNLDLRQSQVNAANGTNFSLPVPYFTQLMGYAFGLEPKTIEFNKLNIGIDPALAKMQERARQIELAEQEAAQKKAAAKAKSAERAKEAGGKA